MRPLVTREKVSWYWFILPASISTNENQSASLGETAPHVSEGSQSDWYFSWRWQTIARSRSESFRSTRSKTISSKVRIRLHPWKSDSQICRPGFTPSRSFLSIGWSIDYLLTIFPLFHFWSGNFVDAYHNLTYKHVMGLKWVWEHCSRVPRVMKMDDDIFVHIFNFHKLLRNTSENTNSLICYVQQQMPVTRDQGSKWMVRTPEYPLFYYEDYCSGTELHQTSAALISAIGNSILEDLDEALSLSFREGSLWVKLDNLIF